MTYKPDPYHDAGHRPRINDKRKREHEKEVMPVEANRPMPLNSPANVPSGGGAAGDHVEKLVDLVAAYRRQAGEAKRLRIHLMARRQNGLADAIEAILKEREETAAKLEAVRKAWSGGGGFALVQACDAAMEKGEE